MSFDFNRDKGKRKLAIFSLITLAAFLLSLPLVVQAKVINLGASSDVIYVDGNLGIGTTTPSYQLDIEGDLRVTDSAFFNGSTFIQDSNGAVNSWWGWYAWDKEFQFNKRSSTNTFVNNIFTANWDTSNFILVPTVGRVGIGTSSPDSKLHLIPGATPGFINAGTTQLSSLGGSGNVIVMADNAGGLYATSSAAIIPVIPDQLWSGTKNSDIWNGDNGAGNVGIGTITPSQKLDVAGVITASTGYRVNNAVATAGQYLRGNGTNFVAGTIQASDVPTLNQNTTGYAGTLINEDNRTISPSELAANRMKFGFTSYNNNNGSPWADFLHFRSYQDASGGLDNLLVFNKSTGLGMRLYQQAYGSATAYSTYKDVVLANNTPTLNFLTKYASVGNNVSVANSLIYDNGSTIGIGITAPTSKLHLVSGATPGFINTGSTQLSMLGGGGNKIVMADASGTLYGGGSVLDGLGQENFVAKWIDADTLSIGVIYDNNNVGIGNTAPAYRLDVSGDTRTGKIITSRLGHAGTYNSAEVQGIWSMGDAYQINTSLDTFGNLYGIGYAYNQNGGSPFASDHQIVFTNAGSITSAIGLTTGRAYFSGNVGIGTTNPGSRLAAVGTLTGGAPLVAAQFFNTAAYSSGSNQAPVRIEMGRGQLHGYIESGSVSDTDSSSGYLAFGNRQPVNSIAEVMRIHQSGNVGIGTTDPFAKLHVVNTSATAGAVETIISRAIGDINFRLETRKGVATNNSGDVVSKLGLTYNGTANSFINFHRGGGTTGGFMSFSTNNDTEAMRITNDSSVGVGITNPGVKLEVSAAASGGSFRNNGPTTHILLGGVPGGGIVMADLTGTLYSATTSDIVPPELMLPPGTSGSTLRHNGTSWVSNTNLYNNGTNVGIGDASPLAKLQIQNQGVFNTVTPGPAAYYGLHFSGQTTADYATGITWNGGNTGTQAGIYVQGSGAYGTKMYFATTQSYATGAQTRMMIDQNGNVGIGTTAPGTNKLYVNGSVAIGGTNPLSFVSYGGGWNMTDTTWIRSTGNKSIYHNTGILRTDGNLQVGANGATLNVVSGGNFSVHSSVLFANTANVGIGTTAPDTKLDILNGSLSNTTSGYLTHYRNVLTSYINDGGYTGTMKIVLPKPSDTMVDITIKGYDYTNIGAWEVRISGYLYAGTGGGWYTNNHKVQIIGSAPFSKVRLAWDGSNPIILLGETTTTWSYSSVVVSDFIASFRGVRGWGSGWSASIITNETGITTIATPTIYTFITPGGSVGIGTTNPGAKLEINASGANPGLISRGTIQFPYFASAGNKILAHDNNGTLYQSNLSEASSALHINEGIVFKRTAITQANSPYNVAAGDYIIGITSLTSALTINLPDCTSVGRSLIIVNETGSTQNITLDPYSTDTILGNATFTFNGMYNSVPLYCSGTAWHIY